MMEILLLGLPLLLLLVAVVLNVYLRSTAFKTVIACADEQSARVLPEPPVEGGVVGMSTGPVDPEVSIVVPVQNEADALSRHLPLFLSQRFARYEVGVATAAAADALTADVVKNFQDHHAHLRYTFVPESRRRNVDAHKVAVALGIRAARAPWVVVVEPDCAPSSNEWLQHLSTHFTDENDVVMGYANYEEAEGGAVSEPVRERALHWARCVRSVLSGHAAAADSCHVAFRREWFLQSGGFAGSLDLPFGACALMASRADAQRVAVEMHPNSVVRQQVPDSETLYLRRKERAVLLRRTASTAVYVSPRERWNRVWTVIGIIAAVVYAFARALSFVPALHELWAASGLGSLAQTPLYAAALSVYGPEQLLLDVPAALLLIWLLWQPYRGERRLLRALHEI